MYSSRPPADLASERQRALIVERLGLPGDAHIFPLSFAQRRLWFLEQLEPGRPIYNVPLGVRLTGRLDAAALGRALDEVVRRHESLRTTFRSLGGQPVQVVAPAGEGDGAAAAPLLAVVDLTGEAAEGREARALAMAEAEARRPFDLERGPLIRGTLIRLGPDDHVLVLNMHHIASDGWSVGVLWRELEALYRAFAAGRPSPLPELPVQYADFAHWQRQWLSGEVLEGQMAFWRERLGGAPPVLEVPSDRARPAVPSHDGATVARELPAALADGVARLARRTGATPFMVSLAAFAALLCRLTGQDDIVVGTPIANRTRQETEGLIGLFVNTLALRLDLGGDPTFGELLGRMREATLEAYAHQDLPFEQLVEALNPGRDMARSPLFQVMLALDPGPLADVRLPGVAAEDLSLHNGGAKFDLSLFVRERGGRLVTVMEYATDLFDAATIDRLLGHFETLLAAAVADPARRVCGLPLLTPPEVAELGRWNDTARDYPAGCLHELIAAQAARTPDAPAVAFEGRHLSYRELDRRANQLAHCLRRWGVGPDVLVGLCMERSLEMVVGLLGILKAGGAYVPLDPGYPRERLAFMVEDARMPVVMTTGRLLAALPESPARVLCLDAEWDAIARESAASPAAGVRPENLAYCIFTSGSTGRPKGAMIPHAGIVNRLLWMQDEYNLTATDRVLQKTPFSFDVSVWEFFWPLIVGACLVVARPEGHRDGAYLAGLIDEAGVTTLHFVPSMLQVFLDEAPPGRCRSLRQVMCSGEALPYQLQERFFSRLDAALHNLYGPTEASVDVTYWPCERDGGRRTVPIGRPIANTQMRILDQRLAPVPVGVPGELFIGGRGLGRCYVRRPDLTAERFIPDPLGAPGSRLYRTGDLTRYLPDGAIEYLGRTDFQVKIRGFRVELGEIETALGEGPAVRDAVVSLREDAPGPKRLVAYIVCAQGQSPSAAELRRALKDRLPDYMVPSAFVFLDELPLTPSGKVDRRALPAPARDRAATEGEFVAPRTPVEGVLCGIWAEVLDLERVGAADDFFELGGHSLLATQVISRIRSAFKVELPLRALFEGPTVAALAAAVERARGAGRVAEAPPLVPAARGGGAPAQGGEEPLSYAQQRLWFLEQLEPGRPIYNVPLGVRLTGRLDAAALGRALDEVVRRHESLRTTFRSRGGRPVQVVAPAGGAAAAPLLAVVDLTGEAGEGNAAEGREARALAMAEAEARRPFDLERGPLIRGTLIRLGAADHVLVLNMHHVASDGWSVGVLWRELEALYGAFAAGRPSPLAELPVQYADFARWQRQWLCGEVLDGQLAFWRERLGGAPPVLEVPSDRARPTVSSYNGATAARELPEALAGGVTRLARKAGATPFMVSLAAFAALLCRLTGQDDIVVGTPIANRTRQETEGLIGFFVNTLALRLDVGGDPTFGELLGRVREATLEAYAHQDLPFEQLVEALNPGRDMARSPLFQVMLAFQNVPGLDLTLAGLQAEDLNLHNGGAKFDLSLFLWEKDRRLAAVLEYAGDLFDAATAARMLGHLETLLAAAVADPARRVSQLPLLSAAETEWLAGVNDTGAEFARDRCVHELFEAQAAATPQATAAVMGGERLSYAGLDGRADRLAGRLRELGVGPGSLVGVCVERSLEMAVGVLGVLKAGAAYVPLDPGYPRERLAFMLDDARPAALLTQRRLLGALPDNAPPAVCLDDPADAGGQGAGGAGDGAAAGRVSSRVTPLFPAYVIYTSGSTGAPKGVIMPHRPLANLVQWQAARSRCGPGARTLQFASLSFDVAFQEMFSTWCSGGALVLLPEAARRELASLPRLMAEAGVERLFLPFVALHGLAEACAGQGRFLGALREVITAGERLEATPAVRRLFEALGAATLDNQYGPSESHVVTAHMLEGANAVDWPALPPIGRPIANARVYILDRRLNLVPAGVPGELCIGGVALAQGYLHRPELDAERFVPDPFAAEPGARLYRTGDLARRLADGDIEFLGRLDDQVKIRGFRVEPGEVEAALARCPGVSEAVVVARDWAPHDRRLAAYIVPTRGEPPSPEGLRDSLAGRLPEYMVPAAFVLLDALPTTPSGKVDRRALAARDIVAPERAGLEAPQGQVEEALAGVWARLLGVGRVSRHDNFFDLGGHSLLATQLLSRVSDAFGVQLPVRAVFERPTLVGLARAVEAARAQVAEDGAAPDAPEAGGLGPLPPLLPAPRDGELALSFAQERLWFLDRLEPGLAVYNMPLAVRLLGQLDAPALRRGINEVVRRHESLRTSFGDVDGRAVQRVVPRLELDVPTIDVAAPAGATGASEERARSVAEQLARQPFDLGGPLVRAALLRLGPADHVLLIVVHHIISDGWSTVILMRELTALYAAFAAGEPSPLPELPAQYADFAHWQRQWLAGPSLEAEVAFWREELGARPPALELAGDRPRPPAANYRGGTRRLVIARETAQAMYQLSASEGCTPFMALLAAFYVLLCRYTGEHDIVVGTPVANRNRVELEGLIGLFVNTLPLRCDLSGDPTFREVLRRVRATALRAYAHQHVPFERLVEELEPERDLSRSPLFQVMFTMYDDPLPALDLAGLEARAFDVETGTAKFDLTLLVADADGELAATLEYNADLFDAATAGRMLEHFERLTRGAVAGPDRRLSGLPLLSGAERRLLLAKWNDTRRPYPADDTLVSLFAAQAARTPQSCALACDDERMTYGELDWRSDQLARYLRRLGVGPEVIAGVCVERSPEMVVALLGVLKAGGAFVALDPAYPAQRLRFMLEDARAPVILTQRHLKARLPAHDARVICIDAEWRAIAAGDAGGAGDGGGAAADAAAPHNLAYVIYTSGSTGRPKGVAIEHASAATLVHWAREVFAADLGGVLASTSLCFDLSIFELFVPLSWGGTVIIAGNALDLPSLPAAREVTLLNTVPTAMAELLRLGAVPDSVRTVNLAGEPLRGAMVREIYARRTVERLFNLYGPTEDTTYSTYALMGRDEPEPPTIGRPVANSEVYILDRRLAPVPAGVPGEAFIGGAGLARGYLRRPDLTAASFIPDPFSGRHGARLYRTGDLARYRPDGSIEFLGRVDHQVKVRGFRIELGEVEAALAQCPGLGEVAVVSREDEPGSRRLVAYVVPADGGAPPDAGALRRLLKEKLPEYMVPSAFVTLDALPLTPNGKLDRRALPAPERAAAGPRQGYVAPRNATEEALAGIWAGVLGVERVGVDDNFFELGGDSILAIQVIARASKASLRLTPRQMFQHQTIAELAAAAATAASAATAAPAAAAVAPAAAQGPVTGPVPLTPVQRWFFEQGLAEPHHWNQALLLETPEPLDPALAGAALGRLVEHHDALRLRFERAPAGWRQVNAAPGDNTTGDAVPVARIDLRGVPTGAHGAAIAAAATQLQAGLDLRRGPLARAALFDLGAGRPGRLLLIIHHLAVDGVSWRVILEDLQTALDQLERGRAVELPPKTTSFQQWARALAGHARSAAAADELDLWLDALSRPVPGLPLDAPGGVNDEASARTLAAALDEDETRRLLAGSPGRRASRVDETLLAALASAFAGWTGERPLAVDVEAHGREEVVPGLDLSRTVGWFTSIYPVRLEARADQSPEAALAAVRRTLDAIPQRGIGFGLLRYLRRGAHDPRRAARLAGLRRLPRPPVCLNYLGQFDQVLGGGSAFRPAAEDAGVARGPRNARPYLIEVNGVVVGGRLELTWTYSENAHRRSTIEGLAQRHLEAVRGLIGRAPSPGADAARLGREQADRVLAARARARGDGQGGTMQGGTVQGGTSPGGDSS